LFDFYDGRIFCCEIQSTGFKLRGVDTTCVLMSMKIGGSGNFTVYIYVNTG